MPHSHAAIFDIDGVLLHLTPPEEACFFDAFRHHVGIAERHLDPDWNSYRVRNDVAIAAELLERHLERVPEEDEVRSVLNHYIGTVKCGLESGALAPQAIDGAARLVARLADMGRLHLGIATANLRRAAEARLRHAGLWGQFTACGTAESGGPKSEILHSVISDLRDADGRPLPRQRIVFLGDQLSDLAAARENGVHFIGVSTSERQRTVLRSGGAEIVLATHDETEATIFRLLGL